MTNLELLTTAQAATELGVSRRTILARIQAGTLEATKVGDGRTSAFLLTRAEVERAKGSPAA